MKDHFYNVYYNIKFFRESKGEKQATIARVLKISQSAYSRIESGESDLSLKHFLRLCEFYNKKPEEFFSGECPPFPR